MLAHGLNLILLLDYNFMLPKYNISDTRFVGLEVYNRKIGFKELLVTDCAPVALQN
jgi:hypothetical protein